MSILERIDPGGHRRVKGLRLVTAYGIAAMGGALSDTQDTTLSSLAGSFALWASVSEGQTTRASSSRALLALNAAAVLGAVMMIGVGTLAEARFSRSAELTLVFGAFLVGYLKRFGTLGAGIGSQIYIGQLLTYGARLSFTDLRTVALAGIIATVGSVIPRVLSGPAEHPASAPVPALLFKIKGDKPFLELWMGLQAALAAFVIVLLNMEINLPESAWAITTCTYVISGSAASTLDRVRLRTIGTFIGVPLGLMFIPIAAHMLLVVWVTAAAAMVVYAMALPERYDVACGAYAFTLLVTLAANGERSVFILAARAWETLLGGVVATLLVLPILLASRKNQGKNDSLL